MSGRSTTVITYEPPMEELAASPAAESEELAKLQEKVISPQPGRHLHVDSRCEHSRCKTLP